MSTSKKKISTTRSTSPRISVAEYLAAQIAISGKTQREIAAEIGYSKPNIITMFKQGLTKLPIEKVEPMANALGIDPTHLLRMVMEEYLPGTWAAIENIVGYAVTDNEKEIIDILRSVTKDEDPKIKTSPQRDDIEKAFAKLI